MPGQSPFELRVGNRQVTLPLGEFQIGRNPACDLVLDDSMVSRRHARIHVRPDSLTVEDAGSRNGLIVDGQRIAGATELRHGQRLRVGSFDIVVYDHRGSGLRDRQATRDAGNPDRSPTEGGTDTPAVGVDFDTRRMYEQLLAAAERAMQQGKVQQLEEMGHHLRGRLQGGLAESRPPDEPTLQRIGAMALEAARRTGHRTWLQCMFELYAAGGRVLDDDTIEQLAKFAGGMGFRGDPDLQQYVERMRAQADQLSHDSTRRLQRLEHLAGPRTAS